MKPNRRNFLRLAGSSLLVAGANPLDVFAEQLHVSLKPTHDIDETYWQMIRKQFPLNKELTYLNNGTMGPSPYPVISATNKGMLLADEEADYGGWEATCKKLGAFVGVDGSEIALTRNVTEGINIISSGLKLNKGDEVILTTHEHAGNAFPWLNLAKQKGVVLRTFKPAATAAEVLNQINALINKKTRVIGVPHILCTQGQILPAKEISKLGKEKGLFVFLDGAHGPGMLPINLKEIGCDAYASCCHKWMLGPKGTGFLYINKSAFDLVQPVFVGAGSDNAKWTMATEPPQMGDFAADAHRYYAGTFNGGLYRGVNASVDFIQDIGQQHITDRILALGAYAQQRLIGLGDKIEMLTPTEPQSRGAVIGFRVKGIEGMDVYQKALKEKIRIRQVHENGLNSLRLSTHIYNNTTEINRFVELVKGM
jgi:selenocysteine lyase/cysteine desulfurase